MSVLFPPLLSESELQDLYQRACNTVAQPNAYMQEQQQAGNLTSHYRGSGLDYAESRAYQIGDEPRFIDWRVTARTGKAHSKQFREERRPSVFIALDRRSNMRFGTRKRIKAGQAARVASLIAFAALRQGWAVAGVILESDPTWVTDTIDSAEIWHFVNQCGRACPPISETQEPSLASILPLLTEQLVAGTHIYLISDFADLDKACEPHIAHLLQSHPVFTIHTLDKAELELPDAGRLTLQSLNNAHSHQVNLNDRAVREQFQQQATAYHDEKEQKLRGWGCSYTRILTEQDSPENHVPLPYGIGE